VLSLNGKERRGANVRQLGRQLSPNNLGFGVWLQWSKRGLRDGKGW